MKIFVPTLVHICIYLLKYNMKNMNDRIVFVQRYNDLSVYTIENLTRRIYLDVDTPWSFPITSQPVFTFFIGGRTGVGPPFCDTPTLDVTLTTWVPVPPAHSSPYTTTPSILVYLIPYVLESYLSGESNPWKDSGSLLEFFDTFEHESKPEVLHSTGVQT